MGLNSLPNSLEPDPHPNLSMWPRSLILHMQREDGSSKVWESKYMDKAVHGWHESNASVCVHAHREENARVDSASTATQA